MQYKEQLGADGVQNCRAVRAQKMCEFTLAKTNHLPAWSSWRILVKRWVFIKLRNTVQLINKTNMVYVFFFQIQLFRLKCLRLIVDMIYLKILIYILITVKLS